MYKHGERKRKKNKKDVNRYPMYRNKAINKEITPKIMAYRYILWECKLRC